MNTGPIVMYDPFHYHPHTSVPAVLENGIFVLVGAKFVDLA